MKKVLIFGDSHIGNIATVYNRNDSPIDISFLPASGPLSKYIQVADDNIILLPEPSKWPSHPSHTQEKFQIWFNNLKKRFYDASSGSNSISLKNFDAIVIYGGLLMPIENFKWWKLIDIKQLYSSALINDLLSERIKNSNGLKWSIDIADFAKANPSKVYAMLNPYLNEKGLTGQHNSAQNLKTLQEIPQGYHLKDIFPLYENLFREKGITLINPPSELISKDGRAVALAFKNEHENDFFHLNDKGSKLMLDKITSSI